MHLANFLFLCLTLGVMRSQAVEWVTYTLNVGVEASGLPEWDDGKGGQRPGDHFVDVLMQKGFNQFSSIGTTKVETGNAPVWATDFVFKHIKDSDKNLKFKLYRRKPNDELVSEKTLSVKEICDRNFNRVSDRFSVITINLTPDSAGSLHIRSRIAAEDLNEPERRSGRSSGVGEDSVQTRNETTNRGNSVLPYNILVVLTLGYFLQHLISTAPNLQSHLA